MIVAYITSNVWEDVLWPNITGYTKLGGVYSTKESSGALLNSMQTTGIGATHSDPYNGQVTTIDFNASSSNSIYGNSTMVQPKSMTTIYIIKT